MAQDVGDSEETGAGTEIDEALDVLEAEVETALNPEALEAIEKEAFNRGRAAAMAEMAEKIQSSKLEMDTLQKVVDSVAPLAAELEGLRARMIRQASEDVAEMALHMARRVVETLAVHPQALRRGGMPLSDFQGMTNTVRVRPQDLQSIQDSLPVRRDIRIVEDDSLEGAASFRLNAAKSVQALKQRLRVFVRQWMSGWRIRND